MPLEPVGPPSKPPPLLEVYEVAHELKCSHETVLRLIRTKQLVAVHLGTRAWRVRRLDLDAFIEARLHGHTNGNGHHPPAPNGAEANGPRHLERRPPDQSRSHPDHGLPCHESSESLSFHQLHSACQGRMQQKRWCPTCAEEVASKDIVKGFEFEKGRYVLLLEEELEAVQPLSTRVIDLVQFVDPTEIEPRVLDRAYYLAPDGPADGPAAQAYAVLRAMMAARGRVGIGKLAIYGREYLVAIDARACLMLYTLHQATELRPIEVELPDVSTATRDERRLIDQLIAALTHRLDLATFTDEYRDGVRRLIAAKIAGEEIVEPVPVATPPVVNLREALEQSLAAVTKKTPAKAAIPRKQQRA
jgi:DNA end-binding protein Ku